MKAWTRSRRLTGVLLALGVGLFGLAGCRHTSCCGGCSDGGHTPASPVPGAAPAEVRGVAPPFDGQMTCPVSGAALAKASDPVGVSVRGETVFVCCTGCAAKVRQNPDAYLAKARAEKTGVTPRTLPVTTQPLAGQKTCPVTGEPLDPNSAVAVDAGGQTIYVCCQGCAAKVKKNPGPYLARALAERGH